MNGGSYDNLLRDAWARMKREHAAWIESTNQEDVEATYSGYDEGAGPTFGKLYLIKSLRDSTGSGLKECHDIVVDYLMRYPDPEYDEWFSRSWEEIRQRTKAQSVLEQEPARKWWQFRR